MLSCSVLIALCMFGLVEEGSSQLRANTSLEDDLEDVPVRYDEFGDEIAFEPRYRPLPNINKVEPYRVNPCDSDFDVYLLKRRPCVHNKKLPAYYPAKSQPIYPVKSYPVYNKYPTWSLPTLAPYKPVVLPTLKPWVFKPLPTLAPWKPVPLPSLKPLPTYAPWKPIILPTLKPWVWSVKPLPTYAPWKPVSYKPWVYKPVTYAPIKMSATPVKSLYNYLPLAPVYHASQTQLGHLLVTGLNKTLYLTFPANSEIDNVGNTNITNNMTIIMINNCKKTPDDISCKVPVPTPDHSANHFGQPGKLNDDLPSSNLHLTETEFENVLNKLLDLTHSGKGGSLRDVPAPVMVAVEAKEDLEVNANNVLDADNNLNVVNAELEGFPDVNATKDLDGVNPSNNDSNAELGGFPDVNAWTTDATSEKEPAVTVVTTNLTDPYSYIDGIVQTGSDVVQTQFEKALWNKFVNGKEVRA